LEVFLKFPETVDVSEGVHEFVKSQLKVLLALVDLREGGSTVVQRSRVAWTPMKGKGIRVPAERTWL
jgi:hypothetical protein